MKIKVQSILASLLAVSLLTCSASAMTFPDVSKESDYSTAVEYVSEKGVMVGDTAGNFNPNNVVNRAEMATIICRMLNQTENLQNSTIFTDVPLTHWANSYIAKAAQLRIVGGYGNRKFGPSDPVTFEQAVTMVIRAIGKEDSAIALGGYPTGYLMVAEANDLLKGIQAQQGQGLVRSSVAVLLYNYYITQNNSGTSSNVGEHTHNYVTKTVPGTGGHYEQVQVGTEQVLVRNEKVQYYECLHCKAHLYSYEAWEAHVNPETSSCLPGRNLIRTEYVPVYEEQPKYENKWVEDSPTTIRVCSICGVQE